MNARKIINALIRGAFTLLLIISLAGIVSCEKKDEPVPPAPLPAAYTIKGVVMNQQTNAPLAGVLVTMGTLTQTTTAAGAFEFKNLATAGKYTLVFTKTDFFSATYSLEFQTAAPNHVITFNVSITMVPFVPGVTPINPSTGGTITIGGTTPATITIPAGTTVTDKDNKPVTGPINITAITTPDVISGSINDPGLIVLRFEPSGLKFSNPLPVLVNNPMSSFSFANVKLEFFNETLNQWEVQPQAVTYNSTTKQYATTITHFSIYKLAFSTPRTNMGAVEEVINVTDTPIENKTLTPINISKITVQRKNGYIFATPVATLVANAGITGSDAIALKKIIEDALKPYFGNSASISAFETVQQDIPVTRSIQPNFKLVTTGRQTIDRNKFSFSINNSAGTPVVINVEVHSAGAVALSFQDISLDTHGHGGGGGGSI